MIVSSMVSKKSLLLTIRHKFTEFDDDRRHFDTTKIGAICTIQTIQDLHKHRDDRKGI